MQINSQNPISSAKFLILILTIGLFLLWHKNKTSKGKNNVICFGKEKSATQPFPLKMEKGRGKRKKKTKKHLPVVLAHLENF